VDEKSIAISFEWLEKCILFKRWQIRCRERKREMAAKWVVQIEAKFYFGNFF
jgi:hypothetical protein